MRFPMVTASYLIVNLMHRRFIVVAFTARKDVKAALEATQTAAVEKVLEAHPGIAGAQIEITEDHTA